MHHGGGVGANANLSVYFSIHTLFRRARLSSGPLPSTAPEWPSVSPRALFRDPTAFALVFVFKQSILRVSAICGAVGTAIYLIQQLTGQSHHHTRGWQQRK